MLHLADLGQGSGIGQPPQSSTWICSLEVFMSGSRVLVVDDDRSNSEVVSRVLTAHGYAVDVADGGAAALDLIEQHPYCLAVVDYQMPGMNGVELFREARQRQPELRGVFLTAYPNINTVFPAIEAGVERVLSKPLDSAELVRLAEELVGPADRDGKSQRSA